MKTPALSFLLCTAFLLQREAVCAQNLAAAKAATGFVENRGQMHNGAGAPVPSVKYLLALPGMNVQLRDAGFSYDAYAAKPCPPGQTGGQTLQDPLPQSLPPATPLLFHRIDVAFAGAQRQARIKAEMPGTDFLNFYNAAVPDGATGVRHYGKVIYEEVWPHIDVEFLARPGTDKPVEYNFILHPGAHPSDIRLHYSGADASALINDTLSFGLQQGILQEAIPRSYWQRSGEEVTVRYRVVEKTADDITVGVSVPGGAECTAPLVIDPNPHLLWGTYYGDTEEDRAVGVCTDDSGAVYMTGMSRSVTSIATTGAHQTSLDGSANAFLARFDSLGTRQWATYFGDAVTVGSIVRATAAGAVYMAGSTMGIGSLATPGAHQTSNGGGDFDAFLAKFDASGAREWATYYGGEEGDDFMGMTFDAADNVYLCGATSSTVNIATASSYQPVFGGNVATTTTSWSNLGDGFLVKFTPAGVRQWGTYYGGTGSEWACGLAVEPGGGIYLSGWTSSLSGMSTPGTHQPVFGGVGDGFLARFNGEGIRDWATYYGGAGWELQGDVTLNAEGYLFVVGRTTSTSGIATPGVYKPAASVSLYNPDAYVGKFSTSGARLWGTYYGGGDIETTYALDDDGTGGVYFAGSTWSTYDIATPGAHQTASGGMMDAFVARLDSSGQRQWGTYYGGPKMDGTLGVTGCIAARGNRIYLTGCTYSPSGISTPGAHQPVFGGIGLDSVDGFLACFTSCVYTAPAPSISITVAPDTAVCAGTPVTATAAATGIGTLSYRWFKNGVATGGTGPAYTSTALASGDVISCVVTASDSCGFKTDTSNGLTITIYPLPVPVITRAGSTFSTTTFASYQWLRNGALIPGATGKSYTSSATGLYRVIVTDANGCSDTSAPYYFNLAVGGALAAAAVRVYPNPTTDYLTIESAVPVDAALSTPDGRLLMRKENATVLDLRNLPNGLYLLRLTDSKGGALLQVEKVIKRAGSR